MKENIRPAKDGGPRVRAVCRRTGRAGRAEALSLTGFRACQTSHSEESTMKAGMTLTEMATELDRQANAKRDFIAPTRELEMVVGDTGPALRVNGHGKFDIAQTAHEQIGTRLGIPRTYYDKMQSAAPTLLMDNVNHWFRNQPEKRMVRTLDGNARAFLSERYRPLDNYDLAESVLPTLTANGCRVESSALTERRLYIKAVTERITLEVKKGDIVQAGIVISNSEIGAGSVKIEPMVFRLVCLNGMIANDASMRKYHVGRSGDAGDLAEEFFKDSTRQADDKAFWLKVRDVVEGAFRRDVFERIVSRMQGAAQTELPGDPVKVIEVVQQKYALNEEEGAGILRHLIKGADLTQWGLVNAITRTSQDVANYDRATELERLGGTVLELPKTDWEAIAAAGTN